MTATVNTSERLLTTEEAAAMLGLSPKTLRNWHSAGTGPPSVTIGLRARRYRLSDLLRFMAELDAA